MGIALVSLLLPVIDVTHSFRCDIFIKPSRSTLENRNTGKGCEIPLKIAIKTPERRQ